MMRLRSTRRRPPHLGPVPMERLARADTPPELSAVPPMRPVPFRRPEEPASLVNAMRDWQAMLDLTRDGAVKAERAAIPADPAERARHLRAFAHYCDAPMVGICAIPPEARLSRPLENPDIPELARRLKDAQPRSLASGIDAVLADLRERPLAPDPDISGHGFAIVLLYDHRREPAPDEPGSDWIRGARDQRACLLGAEAAVTLATYLRLLGFPARAHSGAASDLDLNVLAVASGLAWVDGARLVNPFAPEGFGLAAISTTMELACDRPLKPRQNPPPGWRTGLGAHAANARSRDPYRRRRYMDGPHPFERLKRVDRPTTHIDGANVARVPKRANMFARALFGDFGPRVQDAARNGGYVRKSAAAFAFRPSLAAFTVLQEGPVAPARAPGTDDPARNAANVKAAAYFLGMDAVGLSACPEWVWYSHDATGRPIEPEHDQAISMIVDQGWETMEGASGDDWIACAQSMRAYLRFSLIGGVIGQELRNLGFAARVHTVMDDEVLNPPLLLLSGLGEVSRIGEVILNPFLGPRLKSGVVTTDMPLAHDRPIDFGLQGFCESCSKCARECPSGAITAGPKLMFNGYEIWKSDSQKCLTYRVAQQGGAMCGRCMKTCPWNLEGVLAEAPFRRLAMALPRTAPLLTWLDDRLGRGGINPVKTWWWDLEMVDDGPYGPPRHPVNRRGLQPDLVIRPEEQTLAVYPANLAPPPWPWPFPADREAGIAAYRAMIPAQEHIRRRRAGLPPEHVYVNHKGEWPVIETRLDRVTMLAPDIALYRFLRPDGTPFPPFEAGAHVDVVIAPEYFRQYSLCGDPADRSAWLIAVKREDDGRGGSRLMHRIFTPGRRVFVSKPINHFPLVEDAPFSLLLGGGIGVTPLIAMAHRLHALGRDFALHYCVPTRARAGFLRMLSQVPWRARVHLHVSDEGTRADLAQLIRPRPGAHLYVCGPDGFMQAAIEQAARAGLPEEAVHFEYFAVPEEEERPLWPFTLRLVRSGREVPVAEGQVATDALHAAGVAVPVKCSDGLCGVCRCRVVAGAVDHRDHVLSRAQRRAGMILCRSRAAEPGGVVEVDL